MLLAAGPAAAEELTLLSGEHGAFTRLTLPLPEGSGWRLGRSQRGYELALDGTASRLDLSRAFARIGRDRIAALRPFEGRPDRDHDGRAGLAIDLACACHMLAFEDATGLLVLDIHDGPPAADAPFETPLAALPGAGRTAPPRRNAASAHMTGSYDWVRAGLNTGAADSGPAITGDGLVPSGLTGVRHAQAPFAQSATHLMLQRNVLRAADQDLSDLGVPGRDTAWPGPRRTPFPQQALAPQINVETAFDRELRLRAASDPAEGSPAHSDCPAPDVPNVAAWGPEAGGVASVTRLRSRLIGEFDRPDPEALTALVRGYLHLGFGAEARATLAAFPGMLDEAEMLGALGLLIDGDASPPDSPFHAMAECDGPSALWAVLARDPAKATEPFNASAVISAFSALPLHLRRHLGPRLTERLLAADAVEAAEAVRSAIGRASGGNDADLDMIAAEIDLAEGRRDAALERLADLAAGSSAHAPVALALYARTRLDAGERISEPMARAIAAEAVAHRGTALGGRLTRLEVLGLASAGQFGDAFAARDREAGRRGAPVPGLTEALFAILVAQADDIEFLSRAFTESAWHGGAFGPQARLALAERLLDLGFAQPGRQALAPAQDASSLERHLHARAALALDEPVQALRLIAGARGEAAAGLRGAVLARLGDHRAAAQAYRAAEASDAMIRSAWLAGDDETIARHGSELQRATLGPEVVEHTSQAASALPAGPEGGAPNARGAMLPEADDSSQAAVAPTEPATRETGTRDQGPLKHGAALLERSARMRATLDDLLDSYPAP